MESQSPLGLEGGKVKYIQITRFNCHFGQGHTPSPPPLSTLLIPQRQMNSETEGEILLPKGVVTWCQGEF